MSAQVHAGDHTIPASIAREGFRISNNDMFNARSFWSEMGFKSQLAKAVGQNSE